MTTNGATNGLPHGRTATLELHLHIDDRELCEELSQNVEGRERHDFAVSAMRIDAIALRQAQGRIDAGQVRQEGDRFVENLGHALSTHQSEVVEQSTRLPQGILRPVRRSVQREGQAARPARRRIGATDPSSREPLSRMWARKAH